MAEDNIDNSGYERRKRLLEEIRNIEEESSRNISATYNFLKKNYTIQSDIKSINLDIKKYQEAIKKGVLDGNKLSEQDILLLNKKIKSYESITKHTQTILQNTSKTKIVLNALSNSAGDFANKLNIYDFLMESDKALKQMNLSLGVSGILAENFRKNIEGAAFESARLGISISDLTQTQMGFSDETGRLASLTSESIKNVALIGKATGLGNESAGQLAGQFDTIGKSAEFTAKFVENTLNSSESLGINGTKTVKIINQNFDKLNKYRFQGGVDAFKKMVQFSQITKQNLEGVFNAVEKFRTLEGAIEASAELQTLGGSMGNIDAFQMGFLARNDPEQFAKKLNDMTKGIYAFNSATGQFSASAVDLDRLRRMAEITGQDYGNLVDEARKASELEFKKSQLFGLSDEDKIAVAQLATLNEKTKTFQIQLDGKNIDIDKLSKQQVELLRNQEKTLADRIKASQTFDETYQNTLIQLKTALLPILTLLNKGLTALNDLGSFWGTAGVLLGGGLLASVSGKLGTMISSTLNFGINKLFKIKNLTNERVNTSSRSLLPPTKLPTESMDKASIATDKLGKSLNNIPPGGALNSKAAGIAAIGVAAVGIGAGVWLASKGVSSIAESFKSLTPEQMQGVNQSLMIMGGTMGLLGVIGMIAGKGLLVAGAGVTLIGAGVWLAATGMANLTDSLANIGNENLGQNIMNIGKGVGVLATSSALFSNPLTMLGLTTLTGFLNLMDKTIDFTDMSNAFNNASTFMNSPSNNLDKLKDAITTLNNADTSIFAELKNMLNKPLQVEFKDKEVALNLNITNNIDGQELGRKMQIGRTATIDILNVRRGT